MNNTETSGGMNKQLFRKSSIERVSSPEQLNDYVRVTTPGVWMILTAVIVLLAGVCVWGIFGHLDTKTETAGICVDGVFTCYAKEEDAARVKQGMTVTVDGNSFAVSKVSAMPVSADGEMDEYLLYLGGFSEGEWLYEITADTDIPDGIYKAQIVTESVSPMSFIMN